jgi:LDH2 family malate/lactate/ureidoglycolate dehydrogenase
MNIAPTDGIRVPMENLRTLVADIFKKVPIPEEHAELIAELLVDTDLRGVVSHGVNSVERYVRSFQEGKANTHPDVQVLREGPVTAALSGDGGMGMMVANRAMGLAIAKAKELGVGIATTTYHDHIGSAGKYVRMALNQNLIGIGFSGRSASPTYGHDGTIQATVQGDPPMAFGMPSGPERPYFLLDMGSGMAHGREFEKMPDIFFKSIGLSNVANIMSGTLGGQMLPQFDRRNTQYRGADQSGYFMALDIERFVSLQDFTDNMDYLMDEVNKMQPFPGYAEANLPGGPEWKREQQYAKEGIPISAESVASLEKRAGEFGLAVPW